MLDLFLTFAVIASTAFTITLLMLPKRYLQHSPHTATSSASAKDEPKTSVQVLVLGDIGRSPRMQYHAMSIAKHGGRVDVIGYKESALHPGLVNNPLITIVPLPFPPRILRANTLPFILTGPLKVLWQIWSLFQALGYRTEPSRWLLVQVIPFYPFYWPTLTSMSQSPPSIPTLLVAMVICFLRKTQLIIDWHNYGWTILSGTRGRNHPFVKISKQYEAFLGRWAPTASFTVTDAMARQLRNAPYNIRSPILALHDRPASIFQPIPNKEARRAFLERLPETKAYAIDIMAGKTRLLVSSTSWTPDEDFNLLLEALCSYAPLTSITKPASPLPRILAIITGKGPQKQMYLDRIASLTNDSKLNNVTISTSWLSIEDYATLLACADLGVCLHMSSSGVDLPMKVVDMFGAGLPVAGFGDYESWRELVKEGVNGRGFVTSKDLARVLEDLFSDSNGVELQRLRKGAVQEGIRRWDEEWDGVAGRLLGLCD